MEKTPQRVVKRVCQPPGANTLAHLNRAFRLMILSNMVYTFGYMDYVDPDKTPDLDFLSV